ncbi:MAG: hypothetical protein ABH821_01255 [archaeon]
MVLGFFEGSIELSLPKSNLAFGETIEGNLKLKLKKEKQARQLKVSIIAEKQVRQYSGVIGTGKSSGSRNEKLFTVDVILDSEKTFPSGEKNYSFKLQVPFENSIPKDATGTLGTAVKGLQMLSGQTSQIKWFVEGVLDVPKGKDISKRIQVSVQ